MDEPSGCGMTTAILAISAGVAAFGVTVWWVPRTVVAIMRSHDARYFITSR